MENGISAMQRTFPKKTTTTNQKIGNFSRRGKRRPQKYIHSIFDESEGDFSEDEARVEVQKQQQPKNWTTNKIGKRVTFAEKSAVEQVQKEATVVEDDKFDNYIPPIDDGFDTWIPPPPDDDRRRKKCGKYANSWKKQMRIMFDEEENSTGLDSQQISAKHVEDENKFPRNKSYPSNKGEGIDENYLNKEKEGFVGASRHARSGISSAQSSKYEEADSENTEFREEIANLPLGKAKQLRERLGTKLFDKAFFDEDPSRKPNKKSTQRNFLRENPKRPREVSSKAPVSKFRNVFDNEKLERPKIDPRFDNRCGEFNDYIHRNNYGFLNEIRQQEKKVIMEELRKAKQEGRADKRDRLKEALRKMNNQEKTQAAADRRKEIIREIRRENNERMRQGLPPVFKTRGQIRQLEWQKKYEELKGGKKLENYIRRKTKKQDRRQRAPIYEDEAVSSGSGLNEVIK